MEGSELFDGATDERDGPAPAAATATSAETATIAGAMRGRGKSGRLELKYHVMM